MRTPSPGTESYWSEIDASPDVEVVHVSEEHDEFIGRDGDTHLLNSEIGERGWLGNPFVLEEHGGEYTRDESVARYCQAVLDLHDESPAFRRELWRLKDARLACFCRHAGEDGPKCHGDVLVSVIQAVYQSRCGGDDR